MLLALVAEVSNRLQSKLDVRPILKKLVALYNEEPLPEEKKPAPEKPAATPPKTAQKPAPTPPKEEAADNQQKTLQKTRDNLKSSFVETTIRVDISRLDNLMNLVGELVGNRNRMMQLGKQMMEEIGDTDTIDQLNEATNQLDFITAELQDAVMHTRMLPVAKVFNKFPRMVRDLAKARKKSIELVISGEDTELDKALVEEIGDPLIHIIRNSIDHGIEETEVRKAQGKDPQGKVYLSAFQEGNHIAIQIKDDGKGLDVEAIKRKAIERGILDQERSESISDKEAMQLIFAPGLSTAKQVTDISGRGVGMDVVKTNIQKLNGIIDIDSELGMGTVITFKVPLTLAILPALLVRAQQEIYAIPLANILETVKIESSMIKTIEGYEVFNRRDMVISSIRLEKLFNIPSSSPEKQTPKKQYVVILGLAEERLGLIVDELIDQEEIVIKSMGNYLQEVPGISGAAVRGDGRVVLIMDVAASFKALNRYGKSHRLAHV